MAPPAYAPEERDIRLTIDQCLGYDSWLDCRRLMDECPDLTKLTIDLQHLRRVESAGLACVRLLSERLQAHKAQLELVNCCRKMQHFLTAQSWAGNIRVASLCTGHRGCGGPHGCQLDKPALEEEVAMSSGC